MRITILTILVSASLFLSCTRENKEAPKTEDIKNAFTLEKKQVTKSLQIPAELLAYERTEINARVNAYVLRMLVDIGDQVRAGQVLALLEAPELLSQTAQGEARYGEAAARYSASLDRYDRLRRAAGQQGAISASELISAKNQMMADSSALLSAKSTAESYKQLQAYLTLRAPFSGIVTKRQADAGELVGSSGKSTLLVIERPDRLRLRVHIPESYVNNLPVGDSLTFTVDAFGNRAFKARLARKSGSIDADTRTELWEYEYQNNDNLLKPGMYAQARVELNRMESSFVVPLTAVVTSLEKKFVVRVANGQAEWVDVRDGIILGKEVEIFGDLKEGDTILTRGSDEIKPGTPLKTKQDAK